MSERIEEPKESLSKIVPDRNTGLPPRSTNEVKSLTAKIHKSPRRQTGNNRRTTEQSNADSLQLVFRNDGANLNDTPPDSLYKSEHSRKIPCMSEPNEAINMEDIDAEAIFDNLPEIPEHTGRDEKNST